MRWNNLTMTDARNERLSHPRLSVFDLDRTLVTGNSSFAFFRHLINKRILPRFSLIYAGLCYIQYQLFGMSLTQLHQKIFRYILSGQPLALLEAEVDAFVGGYLSTHLNETVSARLRSAQHLGDFTVILSNSPSFLVSRFALFLKVDDWRSTHYGVDHEMKLSHITSILQGEEKASCVQEFIARLAVDKKDVTVYSDSYLDLPFLLTAGTPIAVNPDRKLKLFSKLHQWTII